MTNTGLFLVKNQIHVSSKVISKNCLIKIANWGLGYGLWRGDCVLLAALKSGEGARKPPAVITCLPSGPESSDVNSQAYSSSREREQWSEFFQFLSGVKPEF